MTRAVVGTTLGSLMALLVLLAGPQSMQRAMALGGSNAWPMAILISGVVGYGAGFLWNPERPRRWAGVATWIGGWLLAVLLLITGVALFTSGD